jgi:hypothetical protein
MVQDPEVDGSRCFHQRVVKLGRPLREGENFESRITGLAEKLVKRKKRILI